MTSQLDYSPEQERYDTETFESQPYNGFAEADRERHYLFAAGFSTYCECSRCEGEREAENGEWEQQMERDEQLEAMSVEDLDAEAARLFDESAARQARDNAPDPWAGDDTLPPF